MLWAVVERARSPLIYQMTSVTERSGYSLTPHRDRDRTLQVMTTCSGGCCAPLLPLLLGGAGPCRVVPCNARMCTRRQMCACDVCVRPGCTLSMCVFVCVCRVAKVLTRVRAVNKTDSAVMGSKLRTLADVFQASEADLGAVPGLGPAKVKRLFAAFDTPFYVGRTQAAAGGGAAVDGSGAATTAGCNEAEAREWAATQEAGMDEVDISDDEGELL